MALPFISDNRNKSHCKDQYRALNNVLQEKRRPRHGQSVGYDRQQDGTQERAQYVKYPRPQESGPQHTSAHGRQEVGISHGWSDIAQHGRLDDSGKARKHGAHHKGDPAVPSYIDPNMLGGNRVRSHRIYI